jgi:hypothetical protein
MGNGWAMTEVYCGARGQQHHQGFATIPSSSFLHADDPDTALSRAPMA